MKKATLRRAILLGFSIATGTGLGDDWPAYRHDAHRSGCTVEDVVASALQPAWIWRSPAPPQAAWAGPAKWDAYHQQRGLSAMRDYDLVFQPVVAGAHLYFGSSADDALHCLDVESGRETWRFITAGPIRIAPTYAHGRLYFGSDDGFVYCVNATDGVLVWRFNPAPGRRLVLNNGRFISFWPCRTGVLVDGGTAYFACSLLPWKESYLCALDAHTGRAEGPGRYVQRCEQLTFEGAFAASRDFLFTPQGRLWLLAFQRPDGSQRNDLGIGGGGCFVMTSEDGRVFGGAPSKEQSVSESSPPQPKEKILTHREAKSMVMTDRTLCLITDQAVQALDRETRTLRWSVENGAFHSLIVAGQTVLVGGDDRVHAYGLEDGHLQWQAPVDGQAHGLAAAQGRLFVSTTEGSLHAFSPGTPSPGQTSLQGSEPKPAPVPLPTGKAELAIGPYLQFTGPEAASVVWHTTVPCPTRLQYQREDGAEMITVGSPGLTTRHQVLLEPLRRNQVYSYSITLTDQEGASAQTPAFECDTFFNYSLPPLTETAPSYASDSIDRRAEDQAQWILAQSGADQGICLVLGLENGDLAQALAKSSRLRIVGLETAPDRVETIRRDLTLTGAYGTRISVLQVDSLEALPLPDHCADLVVSERTVRDEAPLASTAEIFRLLRPLGGQAYLMWPQDSDAGRNSQALRAWRRSVSESLAILEHNEPPWLQITRTGLPPGAGAWTHQYGRADNSAWGRETLQGARRMEDLEVQWIGRPGPRYQPDRSGRKPAPLSAQGRLFAQGHQRIVTLDSYHGTILWSLEVPGLLRMNIPRDCGNWCADETYLFAAVRDRCWQINHATGHPVRFHIIPVAADQAAAWDWGYVGREAHLLVGSAVKPNTAYTNFWGGDNWYDSSGHEKVCSDHLFALNTNSGASQWHYAEGLILNATITLASSGVWFVESRHPVVRQAASRRLNQSELWEEAYLVALDLASGRKLWERKLEVVPGAVMFSLAQGQDRLVLLSSADNRYHLYTFDASTGKPGWNHSHPWLGDNHGLHMARPVLVNQTLYVAPAGFNLLTGEQVASQVPTGRCGTSSASQHALFYRGDGVISMWDTTSGTTTGWPRLRPDCWLSVVPAAGMVLAPEAGGGCWCSSWLETSIAFAPLRPTRNH